jgi:hypothetical protein
MSLDNFIITSRPNKWLEPNWARSFYDITDKKTGEKIRVPSHSIFNLDPDFIKKFGEKTAKLLHDEILKREKEIFELKQEYLDTYNNIKAKVEAGMRVPRSQIEELDNLFDELQIKDEMLGIFDKKEKEDDVSGLEQSTKEVQSPAFHIGSKKQSEYIPKTSNITHSSIAPHINIPGLQEKIVDDDDWYQGQEFKRAILKCKIMLELNKEEASTAGPTPSMTAGYVNPPISTETEGVKNIIYNKKTKKNKKYLKD